MTGWGRWRIPIGRRPALRPAVLAAASNRLLFLVSIMLLATGALMALDAPRTLSRMLLLMVVLELVVQAVAGMVLLMTRLRRALHTKRRPPTLGRRRPPLPGPSLHWWAYEAVLVLLGLIWLITPH